MKNVNNVPIYNLAICRFYIIGSNYLHAAQSDEMKHVKAESRTTETYNYTSYMYMQVIAGTS
jgi:hypothetical protein